METSQFKQTVGNLKISEEVLSTISGMAATEIKGVAGLSTVPVSIKGIFSKSNPSKAIRVQFNDEVASIDVFVKLKANAKIPEVADAIQKNIKTSVQNMTGITVSKVNVRITGIVFDHANDV